ncbi:hypothetical protein A7W90_13235 [Clostridium sp. Bc-iso-3]|nr:hypothetical protein A7W90_13235 [Clostridium sp. Bc-iso-3]
METLFMETTVQADKFLGKRQVKNNIRNLCKGKKLISSTYVLGEFKSNFLKDATSLYNLVKDSFDIGEAIIRFSEVYSKRISSRMGKLFGNLVREYGLENKEELLDTLEFYIEDLLIKRFKEDIDKILIDTTKCARCLAKPQKEDGVWRVNVSCTKKPKPNCNVKEFLVNDNIDSLKKITQLPDHMKSVEEVICRIIKNEDLPYGNNCRTLGDTIIAIEAPKESIIFTTNKKDFEPICEKIDKVLL